MGEEEKGGREERRGDEEQWLPPNAKMETALGVLFYSNFIFKANTLQFQHHNVLLITFLQQTTTFSISHITLIVRNIKYPILNISINLIYIKNSFYKIWLQD